VFFTASGGRRCAFPHWGFRASYSNPDKNERHGWDAAALPDKIVKFAFIVSNP
jgi:hypothetical protein